MTESEVGEVGAGTGFVTGTGMRVVAGIEYEGVVVAAEMEQQHGYDQLV